MELRVTSGHALTGATTTPPNNAILEAASVNTNETNNDLVFMVIIPSLESFLRFP
jgi:hypothetical protein